MRKNFLKIIILMIIALLLTACTNSNEKNTQEIEKYFNEINIAKKLDYQINGKVSILYDNKIDYVRINGRIKYDFNSNKPLLEAEYKVDDQYINMYYYRGYIIITNPEGLFNREEVDFKHITSDEYFKLNLKDTIVNKNLFASFKDMSYKVNIDGSALEYEIENMLGTELCGEEMKATIEYFVNRFTKKLSKMEIRFESVEYDYKIILNYKIKIKNVGESVKVEIPQDLKFYIDMLPKDDVKDDDIGKKVPIYKEESDGAIKFYDFNNYVNLIYDSYTKKIITNYNEYMHFYDLEKMVKEKAIELGYIPYSFDTSNGKIVTTFLDKFIRITDIKTGENEVIESDSNVIRAFIDENYIIYTTRDDNDLSVNTLNWKLRKKIIISRGQNKSILVKKQII